MLRGTLVIIIACLVALVVTPSVATDALTDRPAPFMANPNGPYTTAATHDASANAYVFTYTGVHTTTYRIDLDHLELQTGRLRIGVAMNNGAVAYPIASAGPRYRRYDGTILACPVGHDRGYSPGQA